MHGDHFLDEHLARIAAPTLTRLGRSDILMPLALGERLVAGIAGAELLVFDACAHSPNIERPGRFNPLLLDFLSEADATTVRTTPKLLASI